MPSHLQTNASFRRSVEQVPIQVMLALLRPCAEIHRRLTHGGQISALKAAAPEPALCRKTLGYAGCYGCRNAASTCERGLCFWSGETSRDSQSAANTCLHAKTSNHGAAKSGRYEMISSTASRGMSSITACNSWIDVGSDQWTSRIGSALAACVRFRESAHQRAWVFL